MMLCFVIIIYVCLNKPVWVTFPIAGTVSNIKFRGDFKINDPLFHVLDISGPLFLQNLVQV